MCKNDLCYDCPAIIKCCIYVRYGYPEIDLNELFSSRKRIVIIRKCVVDLISV